MDYSMAADKLGICYVQSDIGFGNIASGEMASPIRINDAGNGEMLVDGDVEISRLRFLNDFKVIVGDFEDP